MPNYLISKNLTKEQSVNKAVNSLDNKDHRELPGVRRDEGGDKIHSTKGTRYSLGIRMGLDEVSIK